MEIFQYVFGTLVFGLVAWLVGQLMWAITDSFYWYVKSKFKK